MRNLKRALSLGLTAAMISGLMVMGSSAAGYADVTSEQNQEAIEVLQTVGIMIGDEDGNFNPDQNVTRNQMAVIMANLMEYNVANYRDTSPFTDVPSWAEPYVAACYTNKITSGYSSTIYGGEDSVTTAQAALMLMKALGYFQFASDFGSDWQLATLKQGNDIDLFLGVDSRAEDPLTRNDVAQLVLNTLRSGTVQAETDGNWTIGGVTVTNNVRYNYVTSNADYADAIDDVKSTSNTTDANRYVVELGEQLYMGDLELNDNDTDVFGRPARTWRYDNRDIGTYAKSELLKETYTAKVTGRELYDLLGSNVVDNYNIKVAIDGVIDHDINGNIFDESAINRNNKAAVGATGNGVLTEVYVDQEAKDVYISIINTYLAIADDDYDENQDELGVTVYGITEVNNTDEYIKNAKTDDGTSAGQTEKFDLSYEDFALEDVVEDDVLMVTVANGAVQSVADPETLGGVEISAFRQGENLTVDGTTYKYATTAEYDCETLEDYTRDQGVTNLKDLTYNVYLDAYGYVLGVVEVDAVDNYVFLTGVDSEYSNLSNTTLTANAIFLDGTMATIKIDMRKSTFDADTIQNDATDAVINSWFTYSVNSNDVYSVNEVSQPLDTTDNDKHGQWHDTILEDVDDDHIWIQGAPTGDDYSRVYGNDESVYLNVTVDEITALGRQNAVVIDDVSSVVTGIDNVNTEVYNAVEAAAEAESTLINTDYISYGVYPLYDDEAYVIAAVVVGEDGSSSENLVYVHSSSVYEESYDKTTEEYTWTRTVISGGQEVTLTEVDDSGISMLDKTVMDEGKWYQVRYNADGEVIRVEAYNPYPGYADHDAANAAIAAGWLDADEDYGNWNLVNSKLSGSTQYTNTLNNETGVWGAAELFPLSFVDTVLYHERFDDPDDQGLPTVDKARTLYEYNTTTSGIRIATDASIILDQERNNDGGEVYFGTGVDDLIDFLDDLHKNDNGQYDYDLSMVIEDGRATTVIIVDNVRDGDDGNYTEDNMATNRDETFRLYGYTVNANLVAKAESVAYSRDQAIVDYSFYLLDADGNELPNEDLSYYLDVYSKGDRIKRVEVKNAKSNVDGLVEDTFTLANYNEDVDIYIRGVELTDDDQGDTYTVTYNATQWANYDFFVDGKPASIEQGVTLNTFEVSEGSLLQIRDNNGTTFTTANTYTLSNGDRATVDATNHVLSATLTKDLNLLAPATEIATGNAVAALTLHDGIVATYNAGGNTVTVDEDDGTVYLPTSTSLTITDLGDGQVVTDAKIVSTPLVSSVNGTTTVSGNMDLYSATKVAVTNSNINVTVAGSANVANYGNNMYIAVGETANIAVAAAGNWTGTLVNTNSAIQHGKSQTSFVVEGDDTFYVRGAWKVTLTDVTATYASGAQTVVSGDFVANDVVLALTADATKGDTVMQAPANGGVTGAEIASATSYTLNGDLNAAAGVKVTYTSSEFTSVKTETGANVASGTCVLSGTVLKVVAADSTDTVAATQDAVAGTTTDGMADVTLGVKSTKISAS